MSTQQKLMPIARASPWWGFMVFFGLHNWFLPEERRRSLGCVGWILGPVFNILSYLAYMANEGIYWSEQTGSVVVKNVKEVSSFSDIWEMIRVQGGLIQISVIRGGDYGNTDTTDFLWFWTNATVEKGGSDSSTPTVIVAESGGKIRGRIDRAIAAHKEAQEHKDFVKDAKAEAAFQDEVAKHRQVPDPK